MIKYDILPKLDHQVKLSSGEIITKESLQAVRDHIKGRIDGYRRAILHYEKEINEMSKVLSSLKQDLEDLNEKNSEVNFQEP